MTRKLESVLVRQIYVDPNVTNVAQVIINFPTALVSYFFYMLYNDSQSEFTCFLFPHLLAFTEAEGNILYAMVELPTPFWVKQNCEFSRKI